MYRIVGVALLTALFSCSAFAADTPRAEVFGGFQYFRANTGLNVSNLDNFNLNGWNVSLSGYFNRFVGVTADFSGAYGTPEFAGVPIHTKFHTFMFGPVVRLSNPTHITPFAHLLAGGARGSATGTGVNFNETDPVWAAGGGLDLDLARVLSFRVAQVDYLQIRSNGTNTSNVRYSAGVVLRF